MCRSSHNCHSFLRVGFIVAVAACGFPQAQAGTFTWDGGSLVDSNWGTAANWSPDGAPSNPTLPDPPDIIKLAGSVRVTPFVETPWSVDALYFNSGSSAFTLSGSTITFQPSNGSSHDSRYFIFNQASAGQTQTIENDIVVMPALGSTSLGSGINVGSGNLILNGSLDFSAAGFSGMRVNQGSGTVTFNGVISGNSADSFAINGGATAIFNNVNTFTKGFTVWSGTAKVGVDALNDADGALGHSSSAVTMGHPGSNGARLLTIAAVTVGRDFNLVRNGTNTAYTIGGDSAHISNFTGTIYNGSSGQASNAAILTAVTGGRANIKSVTRRSDAAPSTFDDSVTKTGAGIVALTGTSNYSGQTLVTNGTLLVNGSLSSTAPNSASVGDVDVSSGAALGGTGTINRSVTIQNNGILAPGDISPAGLDQAGKLTMGVGLTLNNTSLLRFDLANFASTTDDEVAITGALVLDGQLSVTALGGFGPGSYKLFSYTGALTNNTLTFGTMPGGYTYSIDTASQTGSVFLDVVPEPAMASLLALGGAFLGVRRRRR